MADVRWTHRVWKVPAPAGDPHAVVLGEAWPVNGLHEKRAVTCRCGNRYTGWLDTALNTHRRHVRREAARAEATT